MSASHNSGAIFQERQGCIPTVQTFVVTGSTSTTATFSGITIKASAEAPVIIEAQACVSTADGGGSPTLAVGYTGAGYTDLLNDVSTATAASGGTFLPASNDVGKKRVADTTAIYWKQGGTPDGAGVTTVILKIYDVNTQSSS